MRQLFMILACFGCWVFAVDVRSDPPSDAGMSPEYLPAQKYPTVLIAGNGFKGDEAAAERLRGQLKAVPRVEIVFIKTEEVLIQVWGYRNETGEEPKILPPEASLLPSTFEGLPVRIVPLYVMPPPPGVIVLKPGFDYTHADACPSGYYETQEKGWRFCNNSSKPEPIPPIMSPPVAGMPYIDAYKIYNRHRRELSALPGVSSVGLGKEGIVVEATDPSSIPKDVEGFPIKVLPVKKEQGQLLSHTTSSQVRPVGGAMSVAVETGILSASDLVVTAIGHNACGLWLVLPSHATSICSISSPCTGPLSTCLKRYASSNPIVEQPSSIFSNFTIGQLVKWGRLINNQASWDVAAAWLDNDSNQGNGSLCAKREIESWGQWGGEDVIPSVGTVLAIVTPRDRPGSPGTYLIIPASVTDSREVDREFPLTTRVCGSTITAKMQHFITVHSSTTPGDPAPAVGDSGSPILTGSGRLVGMMTAISIIEYPDGSQQYDGMAHGHLASWMRDFLGLERWYGTTKFPDHPQVCQ